MRPHRKGRWSGTLSHPIRMPMPADDIGLFAPGDVITDYSGAIKAIAAGRRAAASIHQMLYGMTPDVPEKICTQDDLIQNVDAVDAVAPTVRHIMPVVPSRDLDREGPAREGVVGGGRPGRGGPLSPMRPDLL